MEHACPDLSPRRRLVEPLDQLCGGSRRRAGTIRGRAARILKSSSKPGARPVISFPQGRKAFYLPIAEDTFAASSYMDLNDNPALPSTPLTLGEPTAAPGESRASGSINARVPQR
jgi:hypothetical protein